MNSGREPQLSEDGKWLWNGTSWAPVAAVPSPSLLTAGAVASLVLALLSWAMLMTPLFFFVPVPAIIGISIGRAARQSLPSASTRDRRIALIGIIVAAIPLALILLALLAFTLLIGYMMLSGIHSIS
ncbi:MAG: hypothetical protein ACHQ0J_03465 [Candidatus Dormibacterales bacterium]